MNRKTLIAGAAGGFALAATVAIAQTYQAPANEPAPPADTSVNAQSADTAATDTAATAGERG